MSEITRNPLCWPNNVGRRPPHARLRPNFKERSLAVAADFVLSEINRLNGRRFNHRDETVIISSNLKLKNDGTPFSAQSEPVDSGVAVFFNLVFNRGTKRIERPVVRACDKWRRTADNLYAIGLDIELDRAKFRYGASNIEQSFQGYVAIPERCGGASWWEVLGVKPEADRAAIETAYRAKALAAHPDVSGGSTEAMLRVQTARDQGLARFL